MSRRTSVRYPVELRERAVRMITESRPDHESDWAAMTQVATLLGVGTPETIPLGHASRADPPVERPRILGRHCFTGLSSGYVLRALPFLLSPSPRTWQSFLAWETAGAPFDPSWARVVALATQARGARAVRPRRPSSDALRQLGCRTVMVVADQSRAHDPARLARAAAHLQDVHIVHVDATHHALPTMRCEEIAAAVRTHLRVDPERHTESS